MKKTNTTYFIEKIFNDNTFKEILQHLGSCPKTSKFKCKFRKIKSEREKMFSYNYTPCLYCWRNELLNNSEQPIITLHDLLLRNNPNKIWSDFKKNYPKKYHNKKAFNRIHKELNSIAPIKTKMIITIQKITEEDCSWDDVCAFNPDEMDMSYSMSMSDWGEWLGSQIDNYIFNHYTETEIIAHCYWEMTWYGSSNKQVKTFRKEQLDIIDKYKRNDLKTVDINDL